MKKYFIPLLLFVLSLSMASFAQGSDHVAGDILVMLKPNVKVDDLIASQQEYAGTKTGLASVSCVSQRMNIWKVHFNYQTIDEDRFLSAIKNSPLVKTAQFNHYISQRSVPNDPLFTYQWDMHNTGQLGGLPGDDIDAEDAWSVTTGGLTYYGDTIVVAIDDCGFDLSQPDLDFDHDAYNAYTNSDTLDVCDHGTNVAGIAGARGNNNLGVTGVNWNVKIMPIEYGDILEQYVVASYAYILNQRDRYNKGLGDGFVVATNSSFGINEAQPSDYPLWCDMYDSMGLVGILSATATADDTWDVDSVGDMPTACPSDYMISVTNTDFKDRLWSNGGNGSAYGKKTIDLGAPGDSILSTISDSSYDYFTGTSQASPHVAGAVALLYSLKCPKLDSAMKANPAATALLVKSFILGGVDTIPALTGKTVSNGTLNVYKALKLEAEYFGCETLLGINNIQSTIKGFLVYPNPANDELNVRINTTDNSTLTFYLTNVLGQQVLKKIYQPAIGIQNFTLDISQLPGGIYFIAAKNKNGASSTLKVVKM